MHQLDDQSAADPAPSSPSQPTLAERVAAKLDHDAVSPANAAMTIGISYPQLVSLLGGKKPPMKALLRIESWLQGESAAPDRVSMDASDEVSADVGSGDAPAAMTSPEGDSGIVEIVQDEALTVDPEAPARKRRGRPRKAVAADDARDAADSDEPAPAAPRKRGRPPKAAGSGEAPATAPKRRGRPPKIRAEGEPAPRRGRPPKVKSAASAASGPAKRRGRPPKPKQRDAATATIATEPKRRGRPPKHPRADTPTAPKRRGRPPKNAPTATSDQPKRRGRPPGVHTRTASNGADGRALGAALREIVALADDALAVAVHRAGKDVRTLVAAALGASTTTRSS